MVAGDDSIVAAEGSRQFAQRAPAELLTLRWYDTAWHEIFNETAPIADPVYADLDEWLARTAQALSLSPVLTPSAEEASTRKIRRQTRTRRLRDRYRRQPLRPPGSQPAAAQDTAGHRERRPARGRPGQLALTPHPARLGSALTNEHVTTDYSESLLELITGTHRDVDALLGELSDTHRHVYSVLGQELIWNQSMPATLPGEADIPIAWYGTSNTGMLKHVYRRGLAERYGKTMQCIAGVHYNYSLADGLWDVLDTEPGTTQDRRSRGYIGLIRNFTRYSWLLMYLFGAAPALARDFLRGHEHPLQSLGDHTLYLPHATSLRMSDLGYQNKAQSQLKLCYNDLDTFLGRLFDAVTQPWPDYQKIGTHRDGQWIQLNTNVLQIENEYYSSIRPSAPPAAASARSPRWPSAACSTWKCAAWTSTPTRRSASRPRPAASSMPSCCSAPRPTAPTSPPAVIASAAPTTSPPSSRKAASPACNWTAKASP